MKASRKSLSHIPMHRPGRIAVGLVVGGAADHDGKVARCGVRDYASQLADALAEEGIAAQLVAPQSWRLGDGGVSFMRSLRNRFDVLHLQYPSLGYRTSLLPHGMGCLNLAPHTIVTLHEHSALPALQRYAAHLFCLSADRVIFTTEHERQAFGARSAASVIPIGANIPALPERGDRGDTVVYFGQIRPGKGIEAFIDLARISASTQAADAAFRFIILGSTPPRWRAYRDGLQARAIGVQWRDDLASFDIAEVMTAAAAAYLPFPDGASLRRGSLLAALSNGLPVIAPVGPNTPPELRSVVLPAADSGAAFNQLRCLVRSRALARRLGAEGRAVAEQFSWAAIARRHAALYQELQSTRCRAGERWRRPLSLES